MWAKSWETHGFCEPSQAVAKEEEVWASIEIQRHYRGYKGRVRAENALELVPLMQFFPGWWQLKHFWNFHPEPWGNDPI